MGNVDKIGVSTETWRNQQVTCARALDILFSSNHNIHKSSSGHCFCASYPLIDRFYRNFQLKGQKPKN